MNRTEILERLAQAAVALVNDEGWYPTYDEGGRGMDARTKMDILEQAVNDLDAHKSEKR